jgi:hypothetical protein
MKQRSGPLSKNVKKSFPTKEKWEKSFGTDSESDSESCEDDASGSAVISSKNIPRGTPESSHEDF